MYYIGINGDYANKLTYYCRYCKNVDETISEEGVCVLNTQFKQSGEQNFSHIINEYTKTDPTLPRIYTMECPNMDCPTHKKKEGKETPKAEIIYFRYDDKNLQYLYICKTCDHIWKTNKY
jgi:hypothetical protein